MEPLRRPSELQPFCPARPIDFQGVTFYRGRELRLAACCQYVWHFVVLANSAYIYVEYYLPVCCSAKSVPILAWLVQVATFDLCRGQGSLSVGDPLIIDDVETEATRYVPYFRQGAFVRICI